MRGQWSPPSRELHRRVLPASRTEPSAWPDTSAGWTTSGAPSKAPFLRLLRAAHTSYRCCARSPPAKPHFPAVSAAARGLRAPRDLGLDAGGGGTRTRSEEGRREPLVDSPPAPRGVVSAVACEFRKSVRANVVVRTWVLPPPSDLTFQTRLGVGSSSLLRTLSSPKTPSSKCSTSILSRKTY